MKIEKSFLLNSAYMLMYFPTPKNIVGYVKNIISRDTGLRKGELLALTWGDIDFVRKTLTVNKSRNDVSRVQHRIDVEVKEAVNIENAADKGQDNRDERLVKEQAFLVHSVPRAYSLSVCVPTFGSVCSISATRLSTSMNMARRVSFSYFGHSGNSGTFGSCVLMKAFHMAAVCLYTTS